MKSKIIYEEEIYPSQLETVRGAILVHSSDGKFLPSEMPVMIFTWRDDWVIMSMSHQSLQ